ncbi:MAG TPA: hypothetical protein VKG25_27220 [Bryobacteraceae bacterium]|nr:hypothetical protein [Bryobacteraceae bacterium]
MPSHLRFTIALGIAALLLVQAPLSAFESQLSPEAIRQAYFLGQRNDETTASFFAPYFRVLPAPNNGPYIAEVEIYTPYSQLIETSRRRSMGYSVQQAELDYRHHRRHKLYVRVRIDFTDTYGALELYRSAKGDQEQSGDAPLPDYYRDFRVGLSQRSASSGEDHWIEPLRIILQSTATYNTGHYAFIPEDLGPYAAISGSGPAYAYGSGSTGYYSTGWLVWLEFDVDDVASDDASVEIITTDGQDIIVPFDLSHLR